MQRTRRSTLIALLASSLISGSISGLVLAAPMQVQGSVKTQGNPASNLRVGAMLTDRNNRPTAELASSAIVGGNFNLSVPDNNPAANTVLSLAPETLDWPGLVGKVSLSNPVRVARVVFRAYTDADGSKSFTPGDTLLETFVTRGRGGIVMTWADTRCRVQAERGFDLTLEPGWNLLVIELGRTIEIRRAGSVDGLVLEVFGR
jgi:hypothetical protein